jgi:hypothetical protein
MLEVEALKSLSRFEIIQAVVSILIVIAWSWGVFRANHEKKRPPTNGNSAIPAWTLYGPVRDLMQAIHDMAEQSRESNRTLLRIEDDVKEIRKEQREGTMLLEDIRNNQVQRGDIVPSPVRRKPV